MLCGVILGFCACLGLICLCGIFAHMHLANEEGGIDYYA